MGLSYRVNPIFQDDFTFSSEGLSKETNLQRTSSFSSGYGSSIGRCGFVLQLFISLWTGKGTIRRGRRARTNSFGNAEIRKELPKEENNEVLLPPSVWPGLGEETKPKSSVGIMKERFHLNKINQKMNSKGNSQIVGSLKSLKQFNELNEARSGQKFAEIISKSPRSKEILASQKLLQELESSSDEHDSDEENQDHEQTAVNVPTSKVAIFSAKGGKEIFRSRSKNIQKTQEESFYCKSHNKGGSISSLDRCNLTAKDIQLQLSPHRLRIDMHPYTFLDQSQSPAMSNRTLSRNPSPSWLLARKHSLTPSHSRYTQLGAAGELGGEGGWYAKSDGNEDLTEKKMKSSSLVFFCKSVCFVLLLAGLVMVVVTVSVFLSKSGRRSVQV
jgi:hypothetical protein